MRSLVGQIWPVDKAVRSIPSACRYCPWIVNTLVATEWLINFWRIPLAKMDLAWNEYLECNYVILCTADEHDVNQWSELLKFLFQCCNLEQPRLYESALHIIG